VIDQYIAQHGKRLYGLCITLCADSFDPDDLYQETWLKVCKKLHLYKPEMKFEYWLTQICVNTWRDQLRHKKFSPFVDLFSSTEEKDSLMENVRASETDDYSDLHSAVNNLPEKLRTTVILHYFQDMDLLSTAQALHVPVGTVKSRLNKARKVLKEVLINEANISF